MNDHLILYTLLYSDRYEVNLDEGTILSKKTGENLKFEYAPVSIDPLRKHPSVRIKINGSRKKVTVCRLIWMASRRDIVPVDFEIHHIDCDPYNNNYKNLIALYKDDHGMIHLLLPADKSKAPF